MTKKRFLLALALMLTAVGGAWAQGVAYYLAGSMTLWNFSDPAYKLTYTDYVNAYTLTTTLSANDEFLVVGTDNGWYPDNNNYVVSASGTYTIYFDPAGNHDGWHGGYFNVVEGSLPPEPGTLVEDGNNQWHLTVPAGNVTLQVEYYQKYALKDIPAGWQILVNGQDSTSSIVGDSLMITETDTVTLIPDGNRRRVKSVTLEDEVPQLQTVHVGGTVNATFYYLPGETWRQAIENHSTENASFSIIADKVRYNGTRVYIGSFGELNPNTEVDPNGDYRALQH